MIIGTSFVFTCDDCAAFKVAFTDDDFIEALSSWFIGVQSDFCPECKDRICNLVARDFDELVWSDISQRLSARVKYVIDEIELAAAIAPKGEKAEVANVH